MKAFFRYFWIQFKMDLRDRGKLLNFYLVPLMFFLVMGAVFASISPMMKSTLAASMSIFSVTMGAVMGIPAPMVKMREIGTLRAFQVNGIPGAAVIWVQAISAFIHTFILAVVIYLVSPLAFHSQTPKSPVCYFIILALLVFTSTGMGLLIGVISKSQSVATMFSMVIYMPSLLLSGIMFPASMLPKLFAWLGRILPASQAMLAFNGLGYHLKTDLNVYLSAGVLAGIGLLMLALVTWRFRVVARSE